MVFFSLFFPLLLSRGGEKKLKLLRIRVLEVGEMTLLEVTKSIPPAQAGTPKAVKSVGL